MWSGPATQECGFAAVWTSNVVIVVTGHVPQHDAQVVKLHTGNPMRAIPASRQTMPISEILG